MSRSRSADQGFTIIEVLFVLAIAGVIMMIVFMAIPTLQRNARNSARKQDIAAALDAVSSYQLRSTGSFCPTSGGACDTAALFQYTKFHFYDASDFTVSGVPAGTSTITSVSGLNSVEIHNHYKCGTNAATGAVIATQTAASYLDVAAVYATEAGNGSATFQCREL